MPLPIVSTARHFVKRAPRPRYSSSRSRSPSNPSVTVSSGAFASGFAPVSTLIPRARDETRFLAQRGVARESMRVRPDAVLARDALADREHRAPLREACAQAAVFLEPLAESVQPFGDGLFRRLRERFRARVDLDPRDDALALGQLREGSPVERALADRLVEQDDAADVL